ncbi:MAG TPA: Hsp20/alpha crystallin family protein [Stellaceae bacterium]|nr:Hsp20/alpha crystallin family protein [Stellaceae bacterium]
MFRWDNSGWMWREACSAFERIEALQRRAFRPGIRGGRPSWEPPADVLELGDRIVVFVALPGVDPATIEVALELGTLTVFGHRRLPPELRHGAVHLLEIPWGWFGRRIALPQPDLRPETCDLIEGCLRIVLVPAGRPRAGLPKGVQS